MLDAAVTKSEPVFEEVAEMNARQAAKTGSINDVVAQLDWSRHRR